MRKEDPCIRNRKRGYLERGFGSGLGLASGDALLELLDLAQRVVQARLVRDTESNLKINKVSN